MSRDNFQNTSGCQQFRPIINSLFRASGYFGQRIIFLVIEAVKHSPF